MTRCPGTLAVQKGCDLRADVVWSRPWSISGLSDYSRPVAFHSGDVQAVKEVFEESASAHKGDGDVRLRKPCSRSDSAVIIPSPLVLLAPSTRAPHPRRRRLVSAST